MNIRSQQANRNLSTAGSASLRRPPLFLAFAASHANIAFPLRLTLRSTWTVSRDLFCSQSATDLTSLCRPPATTSTKGAFARR